MNLTNIYTVVFSPTGTSKKVADTIAAGCAATACRGQEAPDIAAEVPAVITIDLTHSSPGALTLPAETAVVFAVPVYGGMVAPVALERMQTLRGEGTPAVLVAVYGNRSFGSAVTQLAQVVSKQGFIPIAAGAFVGEHSYSTPANPIAEGRPNGTDMVVATLFGTEVRQKLAQDRIAPVEVRKLREPCTPLLSRLRFIRFVLGFRRRQKRNPVVLLPIGDATRCTQCGRCVALCPTRAITRGDELHTAQTRCIRCCACVKGCPFTARKFETPFAAVLSLNFAKQKPPVTLL